MRKFLLILIALCVLGAANAFGQTSCGPGQYVTVPDKGDSVTKIYLGYEPHINDCAQHIGDVGATYYYPSYTVCGAFLLCDNATDVPSYLLCPEGLVFDPILKTCSFPPMAGYSCDEDGRFVKYEHDENQDGTISTDEGRTAEMFGGLGNGKNGIWLPDYYAQKTLKPHCLQCDLMTGNDLATSVYGDNFGISKCHIPWGATASDASGDFQYTLDCYYSD